MKIKGMCGVGDMDAYIDPSDHNKFTLYLNDGNGDQIGTCTKGGDLQKSCSLTGGGNSFVTDVYLCDTYVCGQ